jgi:hypothetical protein
MPESETDKPRTPESPQEPATETPPGAGEETPEEKDDDARVDRDVEETFPASDPPANY